MKPFSILHISDLHRSLHSSISNTELISALVEDRDRYINENPKITPPEAIVVCGDIIQGVSIGTIDYKAQLAQQYDHAEEFLHDLTNLFLDGDRSRLIIVPGNHDIDRNTAQKAMKPVALEEVPSNLTSMHCFDQSDYRWDWKSLQLYRIVDRDLYEQRLDAFWTFFERFYTGVSGLLSVKSHSDANLFSLCGGRIGLAAFNSCHNNDCYALHGLIRKEVIAQTYLELKKPQHNFDLLIAVWHHSIEGPPYRTDYMDIDIIRGMMGLGFRLGLHGHQHKTQITAHQIWLPESERMAVVSAGSLCAVSQSLPTGFNRQYNVLEISPSFRSVRVHVRAMNVANLFSRGYLPELGGKTYVDLDWEPIKGPLGSSINTEAGRIHHLVEKAENAAKTDNHARVIELLHGIDLPKGSYERQLFLDSAFNAKDWQTIINFTAEPYTIEELMQRVKALIQIHEFAGANEALNSFSEKLRIPDATEADLRKLIQAEEVIKR
jgi:hypothetical protein